MMSERQAAYPINKAFLERWSPRAFDSSDMPHEHLHAILEAARWAPSAFNLQPWRFLYAFRGDPHWERFVSLLIPFNQEWAKSASVLLYILSDSLAETKWGGEQVSHSHSFDAGAAWACLALQASLIGYHAHAMTGVDFDRARSELAIPSRFRMEAGVAVGRIGDPAILSEKLRAREEPSSRKSLAELAFAGPFPAELAACATAASGEH
jgi:nitroreductase